MIQFTRRAYRTLVPEPLRRTVRSLLFGKTAPYSQDYYHDLDTWQGSSYPAMARSIVVRLRPESVIDVGCGTGALLAELRAMGVGACRGIDGHEAALAVCRKRGLDVEKADLSRPLQIGSGYSLCICLEVAEHLPPEAADQLVANLSRGGAERLLFSAATPGQGGHDHLNEQPHEYWLAKLSAAGWHYSPSLTEQLRRDWAAAAVARWYADNVMMFSKSA